jgi:hypothetical protein
MPQGTGAVGAVQLWLLRACVRACLCLCLCLCLPQGKGVVPMEDLEPLLGKLFEDVDLSLCSGPQVSCARSPLPPLLDGTHPRADHHGQD